MKILSLFDGISCGMVAFERAGVPVTEYHACEIDKYAIQVSQKNYPQIVRHGSVVDYHPDRHFDYLIGGSPCQGFSTAGKCLAFDDPRSKLFFEYVRILNECRSINPNIKFLLENVRMKKEHLDVISEQLGVEPMRINSALVSAQNRVRYYWTNWETNQPQDRGVSLKNIIGENIKSGARRSRGDEVRKDDKANALLSGGHQSRWLAKDGRLFRKMTPEECEKLQTIPVGYTSGVPDVHRYKTIGDGWTVDVIAHILKSSKE